jgi:hypothetical protein
MQRDDPIALTLVASRLDLSREAGEVIYPDSEKICRGG